MYVSQSGFGLGVDRVALDVGEVDRLIVILRLGSDAIGDIFGLSRWRSSGEVRAADGSQVSIQL